MNAPFEVAVTLYPAVSRFWEIRKIYEDDGRIVPESVCDGWAQLMRIREYAEDALVQMEAA